jgi:hypothetical protein
MRPEPSSEHIEVGQEGERKRQSGGRPQTQRQTKNVCHCVCMHRLFVTAAQKSPMFIWGAFLGLIEKRERRWVGGVSLKAPYNPRSPFVTDGFWAKKELDE